MKPTEGAIQAAEIITQRQYDPTGKDQFRFQTEWGTKTVTGVAAIIDRCTSFETRQKAFETVKDRLEAWRDGERAAQVSAEEREDRHAAEGHYNTIINYTKLLEVIRTAMDNPAALREAEDADAEAVETCERCCGRGEILRPTGGARQCPECLGARTVTKKS